MSFFSHPNSCPFKCSKQTWTAIESTKVKLMLKGLIGGKPCLAAACCFGWNLGKANTLCCLPDMQADMMNPCCCTWQISRAERERQEAQKTEKVTSNRCQIWGSWTFLALPVCKCLASTFSGNATHSPSNTRTYRGQWQLITGVSPFYNSISLYSNI